MHDEHHIDRAEDHADPAASSWLAAPALPVTSATLPTTARFSVSAAILPRLEDAVAVGDCVRMALLRHSDGDPVFTGRDPAGRVARGRRHDHAWFLPADDDADGAIDHIVVHARVGFDRAALRAIARLRRVWGRGVRDLTLTLMDLGTPAELGCLRRDAACRELCPQLGTARVWESLTPFVPPRHVKMRRGMVRDAPEEQVAWLLARHGHPTARVEPITAGETTPPRPPSPVGWDRFRRIRASGHGSRGMDVAFGFRLRFERPVTGPLALGYGAHQGLGQFAAIA